MFSRLLRNFIPYQRQLWLVVFFNVLASVFTVASIPALIPFLVLLFDAGFAKNAVTVTRPASYSWFDTASLEAMAKYQLSAWIQQFGISGTLWRACGIIIVIFLLKNLFRYLSLYFLSPVRMGVVSDFRQKILQKLLNLPIGYYTEERKGDLMARVTNDVTEIEWSMIGMLEVLVREPILILGSLSFMLFISPSLTGFVLILIACTGAIIGVLGKNLRRDSGEAQGRLGNLVAILDESLSGMRVIQGFGAERYQNRRFAHENQGYAQSIIRLLRRRDLASPLSEFLGIVIVSILLIYGSSKVFNGEISAQLFFVFLYAFFNVIEPSKSFTNALYNVRKGMGALERIEQVLQSTSGIQVSPTANICPRFSKALHFASVGFTYPNAARPTLQNIDFQILKGQMVALVGPSGAGKSTIMDLIPRFHDVSTGAILLDGQDICQFTLESLRGQFGLVGQEPILFHDTIRANLTLGAENYTETELLSALKQANALEFVQELPEGIDTNIGERGLKLSGGQRQRITIARALLRNPEILLLDEATSALDSESEKLVQQAFDALLQNRTTLVIAHRLSTVIHADLIVVLDEGQIVAQGRHEELVLSCDLYRNLVELQKL
jgi:ABC-type multidrug transport system fused ATPase/permease subunit